MKRLMVAAAALALGTSVLVAQSDPVTERSNLMGEQGKAFGALFGMVRGQLPYDQAKVDAAFGVLGRTTTKLQGLWPDTAKGDAMESDYASSPKIWENKADFDARLAKLKKDVEEGAPKAKSLDALKEVVGTIGRDCGGCHEAYRIKKG